MSDTTVNDSKTPKVPAAITDDAIGWVDTLSDPACLEERRRSFVGWLLRSPTHVEEFIRISALREQIAGALKEQPDWLAELLQETDTGGANVVVLPGQEPAPTTPVEKARRFHPFALAASAAFVVVMLGLLASLFTAYKPFLLQSMPSQGIHHADIATTLGEQRSLLLEDGSVIQLNTNSRVRIALDNHRRRVDLYEGEAIFYVAKDPTRPFQVYSRSVLVEAVGTRFNVFRQQEQVVVTVVEGKVAVSPSVDATKNIRLNITDQPDDNIVLVGVGHQVAVSQNGRIHQAENVNIERATAWTERRLVFDNDTIATVVREFNRYNRQPVVIPPGISKDRRITGVFNANEPEAFLAVLVGLEEE